LITALQGLGSGGDRALAYVHKALGHINLKVVEQDGSVVQFKIKRYTQFRKLIKVYCE
jgi:hypothetical protein